MLLSFTSTATASAWINKVTENLGFHSLHVSSGEVLGTTMWRTAGVYVARPHQYPGLCMYMCMNPGLYMHVHCVILSLVLYTRNSYSGYNYVYE